MKPPGKVNTRVSKHIAKSALLANPLKFCGWFLAILVIMLIVYLFFLARWPQSADAFLSGLMNVVARAVSWGLRVLGFSNQVEGRTILTDRLSLEIVVECTGFYESLILIAAVLAYPSRLNRKLVGVVVFLILIFAVNLLRMIGLSLIGQYSMSLFNLVHLYVLRISSILIIVLLWVLWILKAEPGEK